MIRIRFISPVENICVPNIRSKDIRHSIKVVPILLEIDLGLLSKHIQHAFI